MDKKKTFFILLGIVLLGILLRLINIDKKEGMWNDEYLTWEIAKAAFPYEFFKGIMNNCHAPLHYIYLKLWILLFSDNDISLRLSSLVPGVLSIISMFFLGYYMDNKKSLSIGLTSAFITSISAFLIYFSQEVRIYSLLFFLSSLNILCAVKTMNNPSKKNCVFFVISSLFVMFQHTIGFVFVFFSALSVILFASKKNKFKKYLLTAFGVAFIIFIPVAVFLYKTMFMQEYWSQWWAPFSFSKLMFFFTDVFSPYIVNITNAPPSFLKMIFDGTNFNLGFVLFSIIPLVIALYCVFRATLKFDKNIKYLLFTFCGMYVVVFLASLTGKIVFLTKYMTEIIPLLILLFAIGFINIKSKGAKISLATIYSVICLFFILVSDFSPVRLIRQEGQNIPIIVLNQLDYKKTDKVLLLYYPKKRFVKYSKELAQNPNTSHISKYDFTFIKNPEEKTKDVFKNGKSSYREVFLSAKNQPLDTFLEDNVYSTIKKGDKFFLVDLNSVSFLSPSILYATARNDARYNSMPFLFLVFSYVKNYILNDTYSNLAFSNVIKQGGWTIYVFEKT